MEIGGLEGLIVYGVKGARFWVIRLDYDLSDSLISQKFRDHNCFTIGIMTEKEVHVQFSV